MMNHVTETDQCEMPTPSLPAAYLRPQIRLPARRVLPRASNYLIWHALSSIRAAILRAGSNFLPALREAAGVSATSRRCAMRGLSEIIRTGAPIQSNASEDGNHESRYRAQHAVR